MRLILILVSSLGHIGEGGIPSSKKKRILSPEERK
jgi:hypothetical protein